MRKLATILVLLVLSVSGVTAATITVSGGTGLQAAINSANPGDVVEITDSLLYNEDIFINKDITLQGAVGQRPTIKATNNSIRGRLGALALAASPTLVGDDQGLYIEADGVTIKNLKIINVTLLNNADHAFDLPAALTIVGDDVLVEDCEIKSSTAGAVDDTAVFVGEGNLTTFVGTPFTTIQTTNNLMIKNCDITDGRRGIYVPDIGALLSDKSNTTYGNVQVHLPAENAQVIDTNIMVQRRGYQPIGAKNWTFTNCRIEVRATNNQDALRIQGGSGTFVDCFIGSPSNRSINCQANVPVGGGLMEYTFERCVICGGANNAEANLIDDANLTFSHCIIKCAPGCNSVFMRRTGISPAGISYDFIGNSPYANGTAFPGRPILPTSFSFIMDHCDVYHPGTPADNIWRVAVSYNWLDPEFSSVVPYNNQVYFNNIMVLTNNIITADVGLMEGTQALPGSPYEGAYGLPPYYAPGSSVTVQNNIFYSANVSTGNRVWLTTGNNYVVNGLYNLPPLQTGVWAGIGPSSPANSWGTNFLDRNPFYAAIGDCDNKASWLPGDISLRVAGTNGSPIGSQLQPVPPPNQSAVNGWDLYE